MNSDGTFSTCKPKKSLIWVEKISTAMPLVNPMVTGYGMNLIIEPSLTAPMTNRNTPAMIVQIARFSGPYFAPIP